MVQNIGVNEDIKSYIKERINREYSLFRWKPVIFSLYSPTKLVSDPNCITIHFKFSSTTDYYFTHTEFTIAEKILEEIFQEDLIWFEINNVSVRSTNFWIIIRDVIHQKSWHRIK